MCGILGVFDLARLRAGRSWSPTEVCEFDILRDELRHRGPDGAGTWGSPGILLGHRRLAILDLSQDGAQPMKSELGTIISFNGEIYNYIELRAELQAAGVRVRSSGDTAVLLAALDHWGIERVLERVRGMFAFAAWLPTKRELILARDPTGKKPLFVGQHGESIVFGSSIAPIAALLRARGWRAKLDPVAINHVLAVGWVPAPRSGLLGIEKIPPACFLRVSADGVRTQKRFWSLTAEGSNGLLDRQRIGVIDECLDQAVSRRLRSDVPVATLLSGGLDSSLVTAAAARRHPGITAYTARTRNANEDEFRLACQIAGYLGIRHRVVEIESGLLGHCDALIAMFGEPFCDSSAFPTWAICREVGREHRVVLTGDGGDEIQGGYHSAVTFALRTLLRAGDELGADGGSIVAKVVGRLAEGDERLLHGVPGHRFRFLRLVLPPEAALSLRHDGLDRSVTLLRTHVRRAIAGQDWQAWFATWLHTSGARNGLDAQLRFDFSNYLPDDLNTKVDVTSMASSVETRAPLLDIDFLRACWAVREMDRVRPWARKRIINALARRHLPAKLLIRRKQGFSVPLRLWMDAEKVPEQVAAGLSESGSALNGILDPIAVTAALRSNMEGGRYPRELLWRMWILQRWASWVGSVGSLES